MTRETRTIEVERYRDDDGRPCCGWFSDDLSTGVCCAFGVYYDGFNCIQRDAQVDGAPGPKCPVWGDEK